MAVDCQIVLNQAKARAFGDAEMKRDQIKPGYCLGDRVLHLNTGVHLKEEILLPCDQKFDRAQTAIIKRFTQAHRVLRDLVQQRAGEPPCRSFFDNFLMTAL